ncbi:oxysterol-binding protein-related protein 8 isoform X3 [Ischnura elegans]|uniref:oxysterol-binding protein-related protein 8 isoform X3 n=1 Tax=Ischnura elegans TaxID=197161 RepID=UPI001ED8978F|nr:oxysterol-binding protein-related protein 8 isoform X3 [Ischnura elegans]
MEDTRVRKSSKEQHNASPLYSSGGNFSSPIPVPVGGNKSGGSGGGSTGSLGKDSTQGVHEPLSQSLSGDGSSHHKGSASPNTPSKNSDDKKSRRTSLHVLLPKLPSCQGSNESINYSPVSPSATSWLDTSKLNDFPSPDKLHPPGADASTFATTPTMGASAVGSPVSPCSASGASNNNNNNNGGLTRKESYKAQRKNYRREKKRVANELLSSLKDPSVVVLADWLKIRGKLKGWTKLWCVLKPGLLLLYKSPKTKSNHWVGTVLLNACQVMERPSKKDGFCFKLFHPLEQSIWAPRGPEKEAIGAVVQPLPTAYLIFRAPSLAAGKCWLDALELALRCSSLLVRSVSTSKGTPPLMAGGSEPISYSQTPPLYAQGPGAALGASGGKEARWSEPDIEGQYSRHGSENKSLSALLGSFRPSTPNFPLPFHLQHRSSSPLVLLSTPTPPDSSMSSPSHGCSSESSDVYHRKNSLPLTCRSPCPSPSPFLPNLWYAVGTLERDMCDSPMPSSVFEDDAGQGSGGLTPLPPSETGADIDIGGKSQSANGHHAGESETAEDDDEEDSEEEEEEEEEEEDEEEDEEDEEDESDVEEEEEEKDCPEEEPQETPYLENEEEQEFGSAGEQVEELAEENKSLIWFLVKQVRPGMDLSKVVLPTFILEPRSFLDRLSDSYYHVDLLSKAVLEDDAFTRMKWVVKWYLSGLYKKPKGLRKPYNPILGETFRCFWKHPNGSRTFYLSEQVSHHPPVSAFYVTNRQDGFCISASILAKSKFYGNSTSAILEGVAILTLLPRGEEYSLTIPYAHCKGILVGTLTMELGGKVAIECEKTGYRTEIEFKLKPFLGGAEQTNAISGRLKLGKETLATIEGHWDSTVYIRDKRTGEEQVFWTVSPEVRASRLRRYTVPVEYQGEFESERLWRHVSSAILQDDQVAATEQKTILEEAQRKAARERLASNSTWVPRHFELDTSPSPLGPTAFPGGHWIYRRADLRPWDPRNDVTQYEKGFEIRTRTRHKTPVVVRAASLVGVDPSTLLQLPGESQGLGRSRSGLREKGQQRPRSRKHPGKEKQPSGCKEKAESSLGENSGVIRKDDIKREKTEVGEEDKRRFSSDEMDDKFDSSDFGDDQAGGDGKAMGERRKRKQKEYKKILKAVEGVTSLLAEQKEHLTQLQRRMDVLSHQNRGTVAPSGIIGPWLTGLLLAMVAQALISWAFHWR